MTKVMLADDEPIVRKALQTLPDWEGLGCEIVYAGSGVKRGNSKCGSANCTK